MKGKSAAPKIVHCPLGFDAASYGEAHPTCQPTKALDSHHPWNTSFSLVPRPLLLPLLPPPPCGMSSNVAVTKLMSK